MDEEVQELIKVENISIRFNVSNEPKVTLELGDIMAELSRHI